MKKGWGTRQITYIKQINLLILIILVVDYNVSFVLVALGLVFYMWSSYISQVIKKLAKIAKTNLILWFLCWFSYNSSVTRILEPMWFRNLSTSPSYNTKELRPLIFITNNVVYDLYRNKSTKKKKKTIIFAHLPRTTQKN